MYKSISEKILGVVGLTGITIFDNFLIAIFAILIHSTVYSLVGLMYDCDFISGKVSGKICYFLLWGLSLVGSVYLAIKCQNQIMLMSILIGVLLIYNIVYRIIKYKRNV